MTTIDVMQRNMKQLNELWKMRFIVGVDETVANEEVERDRAAGCLIIRRQDSFHNLTDRHQFEALHFTVGVARYKVSRQFEIIHEFRVRE